MASTTVNQRGAQDHEKDPVKGRSRLNRGACGLQGDRNLWTDPRLDHVEDLHHVKGPARQTSAPCASDSDNKKPVPEAPP